MKQGTEITAQRAREFGIEEQGKQESDDGFRNRVAGRLRDMGHIIEAHEAQQNSLYDDPDGGAMTGIIGAVAQALHGRNYGSTGSRQIGDDIAVGTIVQHEMSPEGQRERAARQMMANLLAGGMSPDDVGKLLGK